MDPLTLAARQFVRAHDTAWQPPPNTGAEVPRLLLLEAPVEHRNDVLKTLRLIEWQPENRRPFCLVEAPFGDASRYLPEIVKQLHQDHAAVAQGLAEDNLPLAPAPTPPSFEPPASKASTSDPAALQAGAKRLIAYASELATHLAAQLEGLELVLAPKAVADPEALAAFAKALQAALAADRQRPAEHPLRLGLFAPQVKQLDDLALPRIAFQIDQGALFDYLKNLAPPETRGPEDEDAPKLSPERRAQIERELGQPLISRHTGKALKHLMMDGTRAMAEGNPKAGIKKLRAARMLAEASALRQEAILITTALGTAYVSAQNLRAAQAAYQSAAERAQAFPHPGLEAQARFGLGQAHLLQRQFEKARPEFERVRDLQPEDSPLRPEAQRLIAACDHQDPAHGLPVIS